MAGLDNLVAAGISAGIQAGSAAGASKKQRSFNRKEAQKARDFSAAQSATTAQRGVKDLRAAGLNPILAATGNLRSPAATGGSASASAAETSGITKAGISGIRLRKELALLGAQTDNVNASKDKTQTETAILQPAKAFADLKMLGVAAVKGITTDVGKPTTVNSIFEKLIKSRPGSPENTKKRKAAEAKRLKNRSPARKRYDAELERKRTTRKGSKR